MVLQLLSWGYPRSISVLVDKCLPAVDHFSKVFRCCTLTLWMVLSLSFWSDWMIWMIWTNIYHGWDSPPTLNNYRENSPSNMNLRPNFGFNQYFKNISSVLLLNYIRYLGLVQLGNSLFVCLILKNFEMFWWKQRAVGKHGVQRQN